jgi:Tfp pilus tip-associated adhesin PilY1
VDISATSGPVANPDERQRFANWYSYYRNRMQMTKSAIGRAFLPLTTKKKYRTGFITISPQQLDNGAEQPSVYAYNSAAIHNSKFLEIRNFDSTDLAVNQPTRWFNILYAQRPNGKTPLREGLSRVGRYYGGKNDGPNSGMIPSAAADPVQYACQQNFSILTTDGYWDSPAASIGGFKLTHTAAMDNQDGDITETDSNSQNLSIGARPIYDGTITSTATHTDRQNAYQNIACTYYLQSTQQILKSTAQNLQNTAQSLQSTVQKLKNTSQVLKDTVQDRFSTSQVRVSSLQKLTSTEQSLKSTRQDLQSTRQVRNTLTQQLKSTNQNLQSTRQVQQFTTQLMQVKVQQLKSTDQDLVSTRRVRQTSAQVRVTTTQQLTSTNQFLRGTTQTTRSTSQVRATTSQQPKSTNQKLQGTFQNLKITAQVRATTSQQLLATRQVLQSTNQQTSTTRQVWQSTVQVKSCNANGTCTPGTPAATCTPVTEVNTCSTFLAGPTAVASCATTAASAGNQWTTTSCATSVVGPTGVSSCTAVTASAGNSWVTTSCATSAVGPTAIASCSAVTASAGNAWINTTCATTTTGPSAIAATCTATSASAGNSWVTTTCTTNTTGPTGIASCSAVSASAGNSWIATTCSTSTTAATGIGTCTLTSASSGNSWIATTCTTAATANVAVSACTATSASAGNSWITTTCTTNTTGPAAVAATCTAASASAGNSWITTTCATNTTGPTGISACSAITASAGNSWIATTCSTSASGPTGVTSCTATSRLFRQLLDRHHLRHHHHGRRGHRHLHHLRRFVGQLLDRHHLHHQHHRPGRDLGNLHRDQRFVGQLLGHHHLRHEYHWARPLVASCSAISASAGNSWIATTCSTSTSAAADIAACTPVSASSGNSWITTTCATSITTNVPAATCTATSASAGNSWATTTCSNVLTGPTALATCTPAAASSGNSWITTTCLTTTLSSIPVSTCTAVAASAGNSWITTLCPTLAVGPVGVLSCTAVAASAGNSWIATSCATGTTTNVPIATCNATAASAGNNWITTTCSNPVTTNVPASTCAATSASAGNSWITTTCATSITAPAGVASCAAVSASAGNSWITTTCSTSTTAAAAIATCAPVSASSGNSWITTTCATSITTNVAASSCAATSASSGNAWVTTTCVTSITTAVPLAACTASAGSAANSWISTTCATNTTGPSSIAACTPVSASAGNSWITTTCATSATGPTPLAVCSAAGASAGNSWITTTCAPTTVLATPIGSCTNTTASSGNSWITTTCATSIVALVPAATCGPISASAGNSWITTTCTTPSTSNVPVASCTATSASAGNSWITTTCSSPVTSNVPVSSCSATSASTGNSWITTTCGTSITTNVPVASCTTTSPSAGNSWIDTGCDTTGSPLNTTNVTVQSCTATPANAGNSYMSTSCAAQPGSKNQYQTQSISRSDSFSGNTIVASNPPGPPVPPLWPAWPSGDWVTTPASVPGAGWIDFSLCLGSVPAAWAGWPAFLTTQPPPTDPVTPPSGFNAGCTSWPCTVVSAVSSGGSSNSLADVAQYYYKTDLRPSGATGFNGADVSDNMVFVSATDTIEGDMGKWQHMTTFTMGLGVSGNIAYNANYKNKPVGTFQAAAGVNPVTGLNSPIGTPLEPFQLIRCQTAANAELGDPNLCLAWPLPVAATPTAVDDLWHAAVNGRGQYFSAADPDAVYNSLQTTLQAINAQSAAGTGATTSTQNPIPGNNLTFRAGFRTVDWTGDVVAQEIYTGNVLALQGTTVEGEIWSAATKLGGAVGQACDNRSIHLLRMGATNNLVPFTWSSKACDGSGNPTGTASTGLNATEQAYFNSTGPGYTAPFPLSSWSQYINMSASQKTLAQGANLVNFLRGQRGQENFAQSDDTKLFRLRAGRLGDIVNSQPTFVPPPNAQFTDTGYSLFKQKSGIVDRTNMLYVGANDGMLHAFNATNTGSGGSEVWAVIPSPMLPNLYRLADTEYSEGHTYFVDSTPAYGDVFDKHATVGSDLCSTATTAGIAKDCWKTVLVGGYGAGGRGYYAMDITNPATPKALWEFNWSDTCYDSSVPSTHSADCHIGLSFGQPLITKLVDGTWVVLLPSGLNNVNAPAKAGDGKGYLYVLDAITGKIVKKISTGVGSAEVGSVALTGTMTLNATAVVAGSGTAFTTELFPGETIVVNGESRTVQTITSNTQLSVSTAFTGAGGFAATKTTSGAASFGHINAYVENYIQDNTAERVYGTDALGNVWRITLKGLGDNTDDVVRLATLRDPSGNPQPITTAPTMMNVGATQTRMVFVGTGRYLGESDLSDTQRQTVYGLVEDLTQTSTSAEYIANANSVLPTSGLTLRQQLNRVVLSVASNSVETKVVAPATTTITTVTTAVPSGTATTTVTTYATTPAAATTTTTTSEYSTRGASTPSCSAEAAALGIPCSGWYVDLPETGERVNLDMRLVLGTLAVPTTVTNLTACDTGGNAWFNFLDAATGSEVPGGAFKAGRSFRGSIIVGVSFIRDKFGRVVAVLTKADGPQETAPVPTQQGMPFGRRTGWRDLLGN